MPCAGKITGSERAKVHSLLRVADAVERVIARCDSSCVGCAASCAVPYGHHRRPVGAVQRIGVSAPRTPRRWPAFPESRAAARQVRIWRRRFAACQAARQALPDANLPPIGWHGARRENDHSGVSSSCAGCTGKNGVAQIGVRERVGRMAKLRHLNVTQICLAALGYTWKTQVMQLGASGTNGRFTSTPCAPSPSPQSMLQMGFQGPRQAHSPYRDSDCSCPAQSYRHRFDAALLFRRGLACSIALLPGAVATPRQRHRKIPNGGDAFRHAATSGGRVRIRI